ncbi:hypothetical protein AARAC_004271 [Aspergillus arachidicola]|uniref:Uncharacterized protein n=1 Tax=Aspergillus arachidicola TaxID=656916 RepID=A0A2G7FFD3_9EURO|nr:hypothetical protein AARAC_004271 [Aspergillus arachidicola]
MTNHLVPLEVDTEGDNFFTVDTDPSESELEESQSELTSQHFLKAGDTFGKPFRIVDEAKDRIKKAGFVDVMERRYKCPIGPWPNDLHFKLLGKLNRVYAEEATEGYAMMLFTTVLGWARDEVEVYLARVRSTLRDPSIPAYQEMEVVVV